MKSIGELMKELGFNETAPDSAKEAFIKHLIFVATGVRVEGAKEKDNKQEETKTEQLKLFDKKAI